MRYLAECCFAQETGMSVNCFYLRYLYVIYRVTSNLLDQVSKMINLYKAYDIKSLRKELKSDGAT